MEEEKGRLKRPGDRHTTASTARNGPGTEPDGHGAVSKFPGFAQHFSVHEVGDGLSVSDPQGTVLFVNDRLCTMLGYASEELLGQSTATFIAEYSDDQSDTGGEVCAHCGRVHHEAVVRCKDGSSLQVTLDRQPLVDAQGQSFGTLDVITDVTEKARLEQTFRDNAEWHRLIVDNLNDIFWVGEIEGIQRPGQLGQRVDPQSVDIKDLLKRWRFIYVSPSFERVFGYPLAEAYRMNVYATIPEAFHATIDQEILQYACEAMNNPEGVSSPNAMAFPLATATGSTCWSETSARILYDDRKELLRVVGITRDITERRLAEEAVRANEAKLRAICGAAQDAVIMMDADGKTTYWSAAAERMFGYTAEEILGRDVHALLTPRRLHEKVRSGVEEFRRSGQGPVVDNVVQSEAVRKDGSEFPVEIAVSPIMIDGRRSAVGIIRDITERRMAEQALRTKQQRLVQLLDVYEGYRKMATYEIHDGVTQPLVSALMTLDGFSQIRGQYPDAPWADFDAAVGILRDALSETRRLMSGMRPPVLDELGVVAALDHLIREHQVSGTVAIEFCCDVNFERLAPPLETTVFRVVQEGLINAQQHSQADKVRVELTEQGDRLRILVQDWGVGFDPENISQGHFGLEGIRERVRALGGHAQVDSTPGTGTQIRVDLPVLKEDADDAESTGRG